MFGTTLRAAAMLALACAVSTTALAQDAKTKAAVCAACHGPDGNSVNPDWPKLAGQHSQYIVTQLHAFKAGERECNTGKSKAAEKARDRFEEKAKSMRFGVKWPGLLPSLTKAGRDICLPEVR